MTGELTTTDQNTVNENASQPMLVFFDGDCVTCHGLVKFLMRRAARKRFRFVPLSALEGTDWQQTIAEDLKLDLNTSIVVATKGQLLGRSEAIISIANELGGAWRVGLVLRLVPRSIRDGAYAQFARIRYRIFGKAPLATLCEPLPPELRALVLDQLPDRVVFSKK